MENEKLTIICPVCDTELEYARNQAGTEIQCHICNEKITLPALPDTTSSRRSSSSAAGSDASTKKDSSTAATPASVPATAYSSPEAAKSPSDVKEKSYFSNIFDVLMQKGHRLLAVYAVTNACFATFILGLFLHFFIKNDIVAVLLGFIVYVCWLYLALSPLGEKYLRYNTGCKTITRNEDSEFISPIFYRVLTEAQRVDPAIPSDVTIFINESQAPNAFAVGRRSICVTKGLIQNVNIPERCIEAVLAHEFGHLAHKDTDILLLINVGNVIQNFFFKVLDFVAIIITWIFTIIGVFLGIGFSVGMGGRGGENALGGLGNGIGKLLRWIINKVVWLWMYLAHICMMRASRGDEFKADAFAFNLGYGNDLCIFFEWLDRLYSADEDKGPQGFFAFLESSHPAIDDRIAHLQELGATYRSNRYKRQ